jgi:hypothetical protein
MTAEAMNSSNLQSLAEDHDLPLDAVAAAYRAMLEGYVNRLERLERSLHDGRAYETASQIADRYNGVSA